MNEPSYVAATLAWCNERRKEKGQEPLDRLPKGTRWDGGSCPCGQACGLFVGRDEYFTSVNGISLGYIPEDVTTFTEEFDHGNLPQYDLDPLPPFADRLFQALSDVGDPLPPFDILSFNG